MLGLPFTHVFSPSQNVVQKRSQLSGCAQVWIASSGFCMSRGKGTKGYLRFSLRFTHILGLCKDQGSLQPRSETIFSCVLATEPAKVAYKRVLALASFCTALPLQPVQGCLHETYGASHRMEKSCCSAAIQQQASLDGRHFEPQLLGQMGFCHIVVLLCPVSSHK